MVKQRKIERLIASLHCYWCKGVFFFLRVKVCEVKIGDDGEEREHAGVASRAAKVASDLTNLVLGSTRHGQADVLLHLLGVS